MTKQNTLFIPCILAILGFALQMVTASNYGIFQDEYYYIACAEHMAPGYVDHPALTPLLTKVSMFFGKSLLVLRIMPALSMCGTIILTALIVVSLGGSKFAAAFSSLAIFDGTVFWVMFGIMSVNAFDIFFVTLAGYLFIKVLQTPSVKNWLLLGIAMGIGLNVKMTMLTFGFGLVASLLFTSQRRQFLRLPPFLAAATSLILFTPFLLWQFVNDWPTLEFIKNASDKNLQLNPLQFFIALAIAIGVLNVILSFCGINFLLWNRNEKSFRTVGVALIVFFAVYLLNRSNFYYVVPSIPIFIAAGATAFERITDSQRGNWFRRGAVVFFIMSAAIKLPLGIPIFPIDSVSVYTQALLGNGAEKIRTDDTQSLTVPNYYAKRFGNEEVVQQIDSVFETLPRAEKKECGILCINYSFAAAVDYYAEQYDLPHAVSGHNNYWLWGPGKYSGNVMLAVGAKAEYWKQYFNRVDHVSTYFHPYDGPESRIIQMYICREPKKPLGQMWKQLKVYR